VVCSDTLGIVVPFGEPEPLADALLEALEREWDREAIIAHARANSWDGRVRTLVATFEKVIRERERREP